MKKREIRKHKLSRLWQAYINWEECRKLQYKHGNRAGAIRRGECQMDLVTELVLTQEYEWKAQSYEKEMIDWAELSLGPVWDWMVSIKGIGESTAARIAAQIDDAGRFATVSKLWRFCGLAVIDGKAERWTEHYNRQLKSYLLGPKGVADQFYLQRTPYYADVYQEEKGRLRELRPEPEPAREGSNWKLDWTDDHIHRMAKRKAVKEFIKHLWVVWTEHLEEVEARQSEVRARMKREAQVEEEIDAALVEALS